MELLFFLSDKQLDGCWVGTGINRPPAPQQPTEKPRAVQGSHAHKHPGIVGTHAYTHVLFCFSVWHGGKQYFYTTLMHVSEWSYNFYQKQGATSGETRFWFYNVYPSQGACIIRVIFDYNFSSDMKRGCEVWNILTVKLLGCLNNVMKTFCD